MICDDAKELMLPDSFFARILFKALLGALVIWSQVCSQVFEKISKGRYFKIIVFFHTLPHVGCYWNNTGHCWDPFRKKLIWNYTILTII